MRELTNHQGNGLNDAIKIAVLDEPGPGGAHHLYQVNAIDPTTHHSHDLTIKFQHGLIGEYGVNGISNEALLAIVEDRLDKFQQGKFSCVDNALALNAVRSAMEHLNNRTKERMARGVEGTNVV